jgi:DNA (cytosine-5)-methyltransferase 1
MKTVDLFAGAGGLTEGARQAGASVVWAANHWPFAVETHRANHPGVQHACQDLRQADWSTLPDFDLLLAAPCCQGHSSASQPKRRRYHDALRSTAWAVVDCADSCLPSALVVENVCSFLKWRLYPVWRLALERLGYRLSEHVLVATHHGVAQRRRRLFVIGVLGGHGALPAPERPRPRVEPAFGPLVEWNRGRWRPVREASKGAQRRIRRAQRNHGPRVLTQHVSGHPGVPLDEPIRTITTQDHWAIVDGDRYRPLTIREQCRAMGFPEDYRWPKGAGRRDVVIALGNAVVPAVAADVVRAAMRAAA